MLVCMLCFQFVAFAYEQIPVTGTGETPYWTDIISYSEKLNYFYCSDASGIPDMEKNKQLYNCLYGKKGYSVEVSYNSSSEEGYQINEYYVFVPDEETQTNIDAGCEILIFPVSMRGLDGKNQFLSSFCYIKDNKIVVATGRFYQVKNTNETRYEAHEIDTINLAYYEGRTYKSSVKMYVDDYSSYATIADLRNSILSGELPPVNEEDFLPKRYGVLEVPQNIRFTGKKSYGITNNKENLFDADNIKITWTQSDPNYKLWSTEILIYGDMGVKWLVELFSSYEKVDDIFLYSSEFPTSELSFTIDVDKMIKENPIWLNKVREILDSSSDLYSDKIYGISLMIRNKYFDGEYTYYSNWVELYFNDEGMVGGVSNEESGSNTEYNYDDPVKGDEGTDFTQHKPSGSINPDSPYQGDKINPSTDFSITDFVTNGFGLAGEGGVVDMFKDLFSFIPDPVWTLILTGISVLIAIALLKAVL